jgi:hypothetical protein
VPVLTSLLLRKMNLGAGTNMVAHKQLLHQHMHEYLL